MFNAKKTGLWGCILLPLGLFIWVHRSGSQARSVPGWRCTNPDAGGWGRMCKATDAASSRYPRRQGKTRQLTRVPPLRQHAPGPSARRDKPPISPHPDPCTGGAQGRGGTGTGGASLAPGRCPPTLRLHRPVHDAASKPPALLAKPKGNSGVIIIIFSIWARWASPCLKAVKLKRRDHRPRSPPGRDRQILPTGFLVIHTRTTFDLHLCPHPETGFARGAPVNPPLSALSCRVPPHPPHAFSSLLFHPSPPSMDVINDNTNSKSNDMFTRTIYTFTKLKQGERERERRGRTGEERGERMQKLSLRLPASPDLAAGPAAVVLPASVPVVTPSRSWRFGQHHLQAGRES